MQINLPSNSATKIQGINISATTPLNSQSLVFNSGTNLWSPTSLAVNGIGSLNYGQAGALSVVVGTTRLYCDNGITIAQIRASVGTAPVGASIILDVKKNGTTIYTTQANRPQITASNFTNVSVPDILNVNQGDYFTIDVVQVGSSTAGSDLIIQIEYTTLGSGTQLNSDWNALTGVSQILNKPNFIVNPMIASGDMIIGGVTGIATRVGTGNMSYVWTMINNVGPGWAPAPSGSVPAVTGQSGKFLSNDGTNLLWVSGSTSTGGSSSPATITFERFIPRQGLPPSGVFATADLVNSIDVLDFNKTGVNPAIIFIGNVPLNTTFPNGVQTNINWFGNSTTGNVVWVTQFESMTHNESTDNFASATKSTGTTSGVSIRSLTPINTLNANLDSMAVGTPFRLKIFRDTANTGDNMTGNAQLFAVELRTF